MYPSNDTHVFYWSGPFSQWQTCSFEIENHVFNSAEQAMMFLKAKLFGDDVIAQKILDARDPGKQKALGRQVAGFTEDLWDVHKIDIVTRINLAKFDQNKGLRRKLFQTGDRTLAEASPLDVIWGIGIDANTALTTDPSLWPGQNLLGQALTDVREKLRIKYPDEVTL
jgi:ribA/ribD-fused uncharacterized protein